MFILKQPETVTCPVTYNMPQPDGTHKPQRFKGIFGLPAQAQLDEIRQHGAAAIAGKVSPEEQTEAEIRLVAEYFRGWPAGEIKEADGQTDFECDDINIIALLAMPGMRESVLAAFFDMVNGISRKNSKPPRATG